jgi:HEPN domain-containing protein
MTQAFRARCSTFISASRGSNLAERLPEISKHTLLRLRDLGAETENATRCFGHRASPSEEVASQSTQGTGIETGSKSLHVVLPGGEQLAVRPLRQPSLDKLVSGARGRDALFLDACEDRGALLRIDRSVGPRDLDERYEGEGGQRFGAETECNELVEHALVADPRSRGQRLAPSLAFLLCAQLLFDPLVLLGEERFFQGFATVAKELVSHLQFPSLRTEVERSPPLAEAAAERERPLASPHPSRYSAVMASRAADWFRQAEADLAQSRHAVGGGHQEWACFAAQQGAEKAVKAVHEHRGNEAWGHYYTRSEAERAIAAAEEILEFCRRMLSR